MQTQQNTNQQKEKLKQQDKNKKIMSYLSLFILYALIIAYAVWTQSLYSTVAVIFLMLSVVFNIVNPAHLANINEKDKVFEWTKVVLYPTDKVLWFVFIIINAAFFVIKTTLYYTNTSENWDPSLQAFLQVQSPLHIFLPLILFPFAIGSVLLKRKSKLLKQYNKKLNSNIALPLYLMVGSLVLLNQIFSISVLGLIYFFVALFQFWLKKFNFKDIELKVLLYVLQTITILAIALNYLATIDYFNSEQTNQYFSMFGINSINQFASDPNNQGHIICEGLLMLLIAYLNRLFIYQEFNSLIATEPSDFEEIIAESGKEINRSIKEKEIPEAPASLARAQSDIVQHKHHSEKVTTLFKQIQMQDMKEMSERGSLRVAPEVFQAVPKQKKLNDDQMLDALLQYEKEPVEQQDTFNKKRKKFIAETSKRFNQLKKYLINAVHVIFDFLNSPAFSLRVIELLSIIVIQRFNNIYSFVALLWLAFVSTVENHKLVMIITGFIMMPMELGNFVIRYFYNIPYSPAKDIDQGIYGFEYSNQMWLDIIVFNILFYYIVLYLKSYKELKLINFRNFSSFTGKPKAWQLIVAFFFRYSYLLTMVAMFFLGFSSPTLINIILVAIFLIFFSQGDNLITSSKIKNGEKKAIITTFSKKYWLIIVYYTLICILLKYIFFLFFSQNASAQTDEKLDPTGINQIYNWSFNFSLSSYCPSNTTPWFIIFVLAELQIIIFRSYIYTSISFSIMGYFHQDRKDRPVSKKEQRKQKFINFYIGLNQIYYQSLYYVSGIIIIACSYRWCFVSLAIIFFTIIGLFVSFSKRLIGIILLLNLSFIFGNYLIIMICSYQAITDTLTESVVNVIKDIAQFIGFQINTDNYASLFVLNIVNFYFLVLCYGLANILSTNVRKESISLDAPNNQNGRQSMLKDILIVDQKPRSQFGKSVIGSQMDDYFAQNFKKGVITDIQQYYYENLIKKYQWIRTLGRFFSMFWTDLIAIFVILQSLFFRVSVSMLLFLIVYLFFFFSFFDQLGSLFKSSGYYNQIESQLAVYRTKQGLLEEQTDFKNMTEDKQILLRAELEMRVTEQNSRLMKNEFKKRIWKFSAILTAICLLLTYASQFINSDYYTKHIHFNGTEWMQKILYIIGVNVNPGQSIVPYIYFYYLMLIICVIDKLVLLFIQQSNLLQASGVNIKGKKSIKELHNLQNPIYLINSEVGEPFIQEVEIMEQMQAGEAMEIKLVNSLLDSLLDVQYFQQANLLIYFQYKHTLMKINMMYGFLSFVIRFYLWLMLLNVYAKNDVFSFAYFIAVICFWFQRLEFDMIKNINKAAIILLCLQYVVLLFDLNAFVSPLPLPYGENLSFMQNYIDNPALINFLAISSQKQLDNRHFVLSFIVNAIIIFLTQLCFTVFIMVSELMMKNIYEVYVKYENILQKLSNIKYGDPIIVNYNHYKHIAYRTLNFIYEKIMVSSDQFVALLIFILLAGTNGYIIIALITLSFLYIYIGIFTELSQSYKVADYTRYFFRFFNVLQFACLLVNSILQIPFFEQNQTATNVISILGTITSMEQIVLILFIQLWLDLDASEEYPKTNTFYVNQTQKRETVFLRSLAFQRNNLLISSLINEYKEVLSFDLSISKAINAVKKWHSNTSKEVHLVDYHFQGDRPNKYRELIEKQIQQEHFIDDHREFSAIMQNYVRTYTDVSLLYNYIDILRYIVNKIQTIIFQEDIQLSCWSFIKEDYTYAQDILQAYDSRIKAIVEQIGDADEDQSMGQTLLSIRESFIGEENDFKEIKIKLNTPPKLVIDIEQKPEHNLISNYIVPFLLSNIDTLLIFFVLIYYTLNPCCLSFPIIAFIFCYYAIATRKHIHLLVLYIFLLIIATQTLQFLYPDSTVLGNGELIKFLFQTDPDTYVVSYDQAYLYFLFVIIFLSQEVIRYKGNLFNSEIEAQNIEQAFLRVLMNQPIKSKFNIWKYQQEQKQAPGENYNPYKVAMMELDTKVERLMVNQSIFDDVFSDRKVGIDLYPPIAAVQILLMIYMIFFYPLMTYVQGFSIQDTTKYFQFSSEMVIGVLVHVVVMIIERYISIAVISRKTKLIIKYVFTMMIFAAFSWFIYYQAPIINLLTTTATKYSPSNALIAYSFFYFIYFYISALQIKYGYKEFKSLNSLMTRRGFVNYYSVLVYTAIPFLYQLKIIIDWTFTSTSLSLFDWFKQFSIYLRAFRSKIQYYNAIDTKLGEKQAWTGKIIGWVGFILILIIIFGPMVLFSGLNPIAQPNLVVSGSLSVALQVINGNSFTLYQTSHFSTPPQSFTKDQFQAAGFGNVPLLQQMTASDIQQQFQGITYEPYSDNNWGITDPNYRQILYMLNKTIFELTTTNTSTQSFQLVTSYQLVRNITETVSTGTQFIYPLDGSPLNLTFLQQLYNTLTICSSTVTLPTFYNELIRLSTIGTTYKPRPIPYIDGNGQQPYITNVSLNLFCTNPGPNVTDTNSVFWGLYLNNNSTAGLQLYVFCDKFQNVIAGYGFTALYTSIILVVAGFIRSLFDGNMPYIPYEMNPKPENILDICEGINTLRVRKQYREQYLMYYQLIDLIRSPEIMKYMSGSYPYLIEKANKQKEREEKIKAIEKSKSV